MQLFTKHIVVTLVTFCYCNIAYSQIDSLSLIDETRSYVKFIDSINKLAYVQDLGFMKSVADGIIKKKKRVIGGSGVYTLSDYQGDSVFRIMYHDNLNVNIYKTYYYRLNKQVCATLELQTTDGKHIILYRKEEFYYNDTIIFTSTQKDATADKYSNKTNFNLFEDGLNFLTDFHKRH